MGREVRHVSKDWKHPCNELGQPIPMLECDMPVITHDAHFQMYENTTEGTPMSPVFDNPESLARWLAANKASAFADRSIPYDAWLDVCKGDPFLARMMRKTESSE